MSALCGASIERNTLAAVVQIVIYKNSGSSMDREAVVPVVANCTCVLSVLVAVIVSVSESDAQAP